MKHAPLAFTLAALLPVACAGVYAAEPVDHCATMLGSLSVELRHARGLPPGRNTSFTCPKRFHPLIGASRERVLRALGAPDARVGGEADGGDAWRYFFAGRGAARGTGVPALAFEFDPTGRVRAVECRRLP